MAEKEFAAAADPAAEAERSDAAPADRKPVNADGTPRKKKKKKRPVAGAQTSEHRSADGTSASGEVPRKKKKKRPAEGAQTGEHRSADGTSASGEVPRKKKKKRPAEGAQTSEHRSADGTSASGEMPRKKKKKRPAEGVQTTEHRSADGTAASGEVPRKKKKKRPVDGVQTAEHRSADSSAVIAAETPRRRPAERNAAPRRLAPAAEVQRRPANRSSAAMRMQQSRKAEAAAERSGIRIVGWGIFLIAMILYIIIFSLIVRSKMKKANSYVAEYESSRPQYQIENYVKGLSDGFLSDMMTQAASGLSFTDYEKPEMLFETVRSQAAADGEFTYQRAEDFTDSRPDYYILRDGEAIAKVALIRSGWTEGYKFPVWSVDQPASVIQLKASPAYTLTVTMPEGSTLKVNGVEVPEEQYLEAESDFQLSATELYFAKQPMARKCVINGLYCAPNVTVTDADGNVLEPYEVPDPNLAQQEYVFPIADTKNPDEALTERVTALTHAYMDYVINTRCELDANLAVLSNYLMAGSPVSNLMYTIASDIWYNNDPNMREDHVFEIKHVRMYAENLCTVDVHLESTIGKVAVNDYSGTVRWVLVNNGYGWYATNMSLHP
ncbi:MAG: hypothetical protein IKI45_10870 [Oscillospiraceae bacterium]|nr:hypothetical protein [Oscillospiraceae bacterium]